VDLESQILPLKMQLAFALDYLMLHDLSARQAQSLQHVFPNPLPQNDKPASVWAPRRI
jgi:hypothetical protein